MEELSFWVGIIASAAFAITGVLAISERGVDLFGVLVWVLSLRLAAEPCGM
jgi:uncharacterized membrane protein YeiH